MSHPTTTKEPQVDSNQNDTSTHNNDETVAPTDETDNTQPPPKLSPSVSMLKEAFPTTDVDIIEAVLESHQGNVERSFEDLLRLSDPDYQPEPAPPTQQTVRDANQDEQVPDMPPRPQQQPVSPEEQMRLDEEYAKQLALEDERERVRQHQNRQRQQNQQPNQQQSEEGPMDDFIKDIQEELPIIKEKMIEAGNAAKKKMMDWYNQVKTNRMNNDDTAYNTNAGSSMPTSNAQYRGLPSDRDDDYLLSGDMTALHLSDHDVYAQTGAKGPPAKNYYDYQGSDFDPNDTSIQSNVIHVNPPPHITRSNSSSDQQAQILADEEFARQLAQDDEIWRQRQQEQQREQTPTMPPRQPASPMANKQSPAVIVTPRSPLEEYDEQDNKETVPLNAFSKSQDTAKTDTKKDDDINARSYVIGDYDDSDDGLVDLDDEDDEHDQKLATATQKPDEKGSVSQKSSH